MGLYVYDNRSKSLAEYVHHDGNIKQGGFVLLLGMVVLLLMGSTAIPLFKTGLIQEKMAGHSKHSTQDLEDAETSAAQQEQAFASLTDLSGEILVDELCGIKRIDATGQYVRIQTHYYSPPPNGYNWGDGDGNKVAICHKENNDLSVSINAVGDETSGHMQHEGDYLGYCGDSVPDDPWQTCIEKYGDTARRLSWNQYYN